MPPILSQPRPKAKDSAFRILLSLLSAPAEILIHSGDSLAFLGDSITKQGKGSTGWCGLVLSSLQSAGIDTTQINAGKGGHTSRDMAGRFETDVIAKKPVWMILMCGTNDNPGHGLPLEESGKNIRTIVEKNQAAGIKVLLADVFAAMKLAQESHLKQNPALPATSPYLTIADGTHMNPRGNQVIAESVLLALGLRPEQIAKAKESWPVPDAVKSIGAEEALKDTIPER